MVGERVGFVIDLKKIIFTCHPSRYFWVKNMEKKQVIFVLGVIEIYTT